MHKVHVIGLGVDHRDISPIISKRIESAEVLVGGDRLLDIFRDHPALKVPIGSPLENVIERINRELQADREIVVLADGDPLFYGIGKRLIDALGREIVVFHPNVTTLQVAASRLRIPWHDIQTVSLHGRKDIRPLLADLVRNDRVAVFTDPDFHPAKIADELIRKGVDAFDMHVFEDLGTESEKMPDKINPEVIKKRNKILRDMSATNYSQALKKEIGKTVGVISEHRADNGRHFWGITDNYLKVAIPEGFGGQKDILKISITDTASEYLIGRMA